MNREEEKRAVGKDFYVLLVLLLVQKQASVVAMRIKKSAFLRKKKVEKKNCVSFSLLRMLSLHSSVVSVVKDLCYVI